jgi:hypothetical protein
MDIELNDDGSMVGRTFSGPEYDHGYPSPKWGEETYREYKKRIDAEFVSNGFHLGDLCDDDWETYCMGSGNYAGANSNAIIGSGE